MGNRTSVVDDSYHVVTICEQMADDPDSVTMLTSADLNLIRKVWNNIITDTDNDVGIELFKKIFKKSEPIRKLFNVQEKDMEHLDFNGRFISHSRIVKNALDDFIRNLDPSDNNRKLLVDLRSLGARHIYSRKGFRPDFWYDFARCLIEMSRDWQVPLFRKRKFYQLWTKLVCLMIVNMRHGYHNELKKSTRLQLKNWKSCNI